MVKKKKKNVASHLPLNRSNQIRIYSNPSIIHKEHFFSPLCHGKDIKLDLIFWIVFMSNIMDV